MTGPGVRRAALSETEVRILALIVLGRTNAEIADLLGIGRSTVKTHVRHTYRKVGVATRGEAIAVVLAPGP